MSDTDEAPVVRIPDLKKAIFQIGGGTLVFIALFSFAIANWAKAWHFDTFQTRADAKKHDQGIHAMAQQNTDNNRASIDSLTLEIRLSSAVTRVDSLKSDLYNVDQQLKAEPGNRDAMERKRTIQRDLDAATSYADCLLNERPNCDLIRFHQR